MSRLLDVGSQRCRPGTRTNKLFALIGINTRLFSSGQTLTDPFGKCCAQALYVIIAVGRADPRNIKNLGPMPPMRQVPTSVEHPPIGHNSIYIYSITKHHLSVVLLKRFADFYLST